MIGALLSLVKNRQKYLQQDVNHKLLIVNDE